MYVTVILCRQHSRNKISNCTADGSGSRRECRAGHACWLPLQYAQSVTAAALPV